MQGVLGQPIVAALVDPAGLTADLGARIEVPVTRAIVSAWRAAVLTGATWTVTLDAPLTVGDYQLVWRTGDPEPPQFEAMIPLVIAATGYQPDAGASLADLTPSVADVAALLIARTNRPIDEDVITGGTFTDDTSPTAAQVEVFATIAVNDVRARVLVPIPTSLAAQARGLAALWAAALAELSAVPEGADEASSVVNPQYTAAYRAGLADLIDACRTGRTRLA